MICHKCNNQMHQKMYKGKPLGRGLLADHKYITEEIKECPNCDNLILERYEAKTIDKDFLPKYLKLLKKGGE